MSRQGKTYQLFTHNTYNAGALITSVLRREAGQTRNTMRIILAVLAKIVTHVVLFVYLALFWMNRTNSDYIFALTRFHIYSPHTRCHGVSYLQSQSRGILLFVGTQCFTRCSHRLVVKRARVVPRTVYLTSRVAAQIKNWSRCTETAQKLRTCVRCFVGGARTTIRCEFIYRPVCVWQQ